MRRLDFRDHRRELHRNRYVYAVISRRAQGLSIGINLNPDKGCNFACPYCQVDRSIAGNGREVDVDILGDELDHLLHLIQSGELWSIDPFHTAHEDYRLVKDISFAGDGEPTACSVFAQAMSRVCQLKTAYGFDQIQIQLLSNATLFHRSKVRQGLMQMWNAKGEIWAKLDAGTEGFFQLIDGTKFPFQRVLDNISWAAQQHPIVLQSMFHRWKGEAPDTQEIQAWAQRIKNIVSQGGTIRLIQVYSIARPPSDKRVGVLEKEHLEEIALQARAVLASEETKVIVYPGLSS